jgi:propanediol utilization protein
MEKYVKALRALGEIIKAREPTENVSADSSLKEIPYGISGRHIHLSEADIEKLFGKNYEFTSIKELSQPGQFACKECVILTGPKGSIDKVRILGPPRSDTQVELLVGDCIRLGIPPTIRMSGDLDGSPGLVVSGKKGSVILEKGAIVAKRHLHMTEADAKDYNVKDGDTVAIGIQGERSGILGEVAVRANNNSALDLHIDTEEANAIGIKKDSKLYLIVD